MTESNSFSITIPFYAFCKKCTEVFDIFRNNRISSDKLNKYLYAILVVRHSYT